MSLLKENEDRAAFGIYLCDDSQYGYIKADAEGLRLYANELLILADEMEAEPNGKFTLPDGRWIDADSDIFLRWAEHATHPAEKEPGEGTGAIFFKAGCLVFAAVFIFSLLLGFYTWITWLI